MENRGGQDDEMSRRVWEAVETSTSEVGMGKTGGRRSKEGSGKKKKEEKEKKKKKQKKGKTVEVRKVAEEWEIWNKEEKAKKLVPEKFH